MNILHLAHEVDPFLKGSTVGTLVRTLGQHIGDKKVDDTLRILVPRFSCIQERKHRIHEVLRLSGNNVSLGTQEASLLVQVSSLREFRLQVYFMGNEDLFSRPGVLHDKQGRFYHDNGTLSAFFCKAALATIAQLEWKTDVVHCHGWFTALAMLYLRTTYRQHPVFKRARLVFTLHAGEHFEHTFSEELLEQLRAPEVKDFHLASLKAVGFKELIELAAQHAQLITRNFEKDASYPPAWLAQLEAEYVPADNQVGERYYQLYKQLRRR